MFVNFFLINFSSEEKRFDHIIKVNDIDFVKSVPNDVCNFDKNITIHICFEFVSGDEKLMLN